MTRKIETLTQAEAEQLLNHCWNIETRLIFTLLLDAGLRVGELVKLELRDCYFNGEPVQSLTVRAETSKTKTERIIPLSSRLQAALKDYSRTLPDAGVRQGTRPLLRRKGLNSPMNIRKVQRLVENASLETIGRQIHPHILRHTFATRLMKILDIRGVQQLLGHKAMSSTQIYCHPDADSMKTAIETASLNGKVKL